MPNSQFKRIAREEIAKVECKAVSIRYNHSPDVTYLKQDFDVPFLTAKVIAESSACREVAFHYSNKRSTLLFMDGFPTTDEEDDLGDTIPIDTVYHQTDSSSDEEEHVAMMYEEVLAPPPTEQRARRNPRASASASASDTGDLQPIATVPLESPPNMTEHHEDGMHPDQKKKIRDAVKLLEASGINSRIISETIISLQDLIGKCSICEDVGNELCDLPCKHKVCAVCLAQILQSVSKSCPYCRSSLTHLEHLLPAIMHAIDINSTPDLANLELPPDHGKIKVKITMEDKADISLMVNPKSSVSSLRRLALVRWGFPVRWATRLRFHLGSHHLTAAPQVFDYTWSGSQLNLGCNHG
jgi:hypothetical protein